MGPPNAMLDYHSTSDEMSASYTSNATAIPILDTLTNLFLLLIVIQNLGVILDIDLTTVFSFIRFVYRKTIAFITYLRRHIFTGQNIRTLPTLTWDIWTRLYTSALTGLRATPGFVQTAWTLLPWLTRILYISVPHGESITVSSLVLPDCGTVAVIHNLPDDVSAPEVRRFLEMALWTQYRHGERVESEDDDIPGEVDEADGDGELTTDTLRLGLRWSTRLRGRAGLVPMPDTAASTSTPSSSGPRTPTSSTSGDGPSISECRSDSQSGSDSDSGSGSGSDVETNVTIDAVGTPLDSESIMLADLAPIPQHQRLSTSQRA